MIVPSAPKAKSLTYATMAIRALEALNSSKPENKAKGFSKQAIKFYIIANYPGIHQETANTHLKKALEKLLESRKVTVNGIYYKLANKASKTKKPATTTTAAVAPAKKKASPSAKKTTTAPKKKATSVLTKTMKASHTLKKKATRAPKRQARAPTAVAKKKAAPKKKDSTVPDENVAPNDLPAAANTTAPEQHHPSFNIPPLPSSQLPSLSPTPESPLPFFAGANQATQYA